MIAIGIGLSALALLQFLALGTTILAYLFRGSPKLTEYPLRLRVFLGLSVGMSVDILLTSIYLLVAPISDIYIWSLLAATGILFLSSTTWHAFLPELRFRPRVLLTALNWPKNLSWLALDFSVLFLISALSTRVPGYWDDTSYHLPLARQFSESAPLEVQTFLRYPLGPMNGDVFLAIGHHINGFLGAQLFASIPLFVIWLGLTGLSVHVYKSSVPGTLASAIIASCTCTYVFAGYAFIDFIVALSCFSVLVCFTLANEKSPPNSRWLVVAGLHAGIAIGSKYSALVFVLIFLVSLLFKYKPVGGWRILLFIAVAATSGSFWYIRSFLVSGDPLWPANVFSQKPYLWNAFDLAANREEQLGYGVGTSIWLLPQSLLAGGAPMLLLGIVWLVSLRRRTRTFELVAAFVFVSYLVFWFFSGQVDRYLQPILGVSSFFIGSAVYRIATRVLSSFRNPKVQRAVAASATSVLILSSQAFLLFGIQDTLRKNPATFELLQDSLPSRTGFELVDKAYQLRDSSPRLLQLGFENAAYFYNGVFIGDWFGPARYSQFLDCGSKTCRVQSSDELLISLRRFGADYVVINTERYEVDEEDLLTNFDVLSKSSQGYLLRPK
ncbi:MAG: hypothetical protein RJB63_186 [Actinomycetota bacterium]|jgi:hypothetical protein